MRAFRDPLPLIRSAAHGSSLESQATVRRDAAASTIACSDGRSDGGAARLVQQRQQARGMAARNTPEAWRRPTWRRCGRQQEPAPTARCGARQGRPRSPNEGLTATRRRLHGGLATTAAVTLLQAGLNQAAWAAPWKECSFNDRPIPCRDSHSADGSVRIVWQDGPAMTYRLIRAGFPVSILRDSLGGRWEREILPQGNAVFVNRANGNRIVVPLR